MQIGARSVKLRIDEKSVETGPPQLRHCSEWLVIVEFPVRGADSGRCRFHLVLFADSLPSNELRKLRRWIYFDLGR